MLTELKKKNIKRFVIVYSGVLFVNSRLTCYRNNESGNETVVQPHICASKFFQVSGTVSNGTNADQDIPLLWRYVRINKGINLLVINSITKRKRRSTICRTPLSISSSKPYPLTKYSTVTRTAFSGVVFREQSFFIQIHIIISRVFRKPNICKIVLYQRRFPRRRIRFATYIDNNVIIIGIQRPR